MKSLHEYARFRASMGERRMGLAIEIVQSNRQKVRSQQRDEASQHPAGESGAEPAARCGPGRVVSLVATELRPKIIKDPTTAERQRSFRKKRRARLAAPLTPADQD